MPTVVNGIGTWYYGKSRVFRRHGVCSMCGAINTLTSFDTTLFFVVVFVPLIPLGRKRILEQCASCQKHRVAPLDKWEQEKQSVFAKLNEALQSGRDPDLALVEALGAASGFQDQGLFDQVAEVAARRTDRADVQAELGSGYAYFARWGEAETAYRAALTREDRTEWRDTLAKVLMQQGRPDDAAPLITAVLDAKDAGRAWLVYLLVEAYQAQGRHRDALDLMDARERAFPETAADRDCQKQRKVSQKHEATGKPVRATILAAPANAGYREGGRFWPRFARWVGPAIAVGLAVWYFSVAWHRGEHRKIYLVNGTGRPYTVAVNDQSIRLEPNAPTPVVIGEGEVAVTTIDIDLGSEPLRATVETPFFSRPFKRHTFVLNPDRLAAVVREEAEYGNRAGPGNELPPQVCAGELLYAFYGIDYEFQPFPQQIMAEKGSRLHKTRVGIEPMTSTRDRIVVLAEGMSKERQADYARRLLRTDPDDIDALGWLAAVVPPAEVIADLRPRLGDRPVRIDWHRVYQSTVDAATPGVDLRPEYRGWSRKRSGRPTRCTCWRGSRRSPRPRSCSARRSPAGRRPRPLPPATVSGFWRVASSARRSSTWPAPAPSNRKTSVSATTIARLSRRRGTISGWPTISRTKGRRRRARPHFRFAPSRWSARARPTRLAGCPRKCCAGSTSYRGRPRGSRCAAAWTGCWRASGATARRTWPSPNRCPTRCRSSSPCYAAERATPPVTCRPQVISPSGWTSTPSKSGPWSVWPLR
jgi:hypothetical protein